MVWVCHHAATNDITLHASGPKPRCKGDTLRETLYNGEEATEIVKSNGEVRSLWYEAVIND